MYSSMLAILSVPLQQRGSCAPLQHGLLAVGIVVCWQQPHACSMTMCLAVVQAVVKAVVKEEAV